MPTLKDIAESLDLSVMAISKALRDAPDISAGTKVKVIKEAERLGYVPNHSAQQLRGAKSGLVGIIVPHINDPLSANFIQGIQEQATDYGYDVIVQSSRENTANEVKVFKRLLTRRVEAIFLYPHHQIQHRSPIYEESKKQSLPVIFLESYPSDLNQSDSVLRVLIDNQRAGILAVEHLRSLGHKRILFFSGPPAAKAAADFYHGYTSTMMKHGIRNWNEYVFLAGHGFEGGRDAMVRALSEKLQFSAVICATDSIAVGACDQLIRSGISVPEEVSVVGFGDGMIAQNGKVGLTTIRRPQVDLGRAAVQLWKNQGKVGLKSRSTDSQEKIMNVDLMIRESTAPIRKSAT
ncbi:MAG: LacI family DNA-binding transcriptional regulator [Verrucomicrobiota bacterium]